MITDYKQKKGQVQLLVNQADPWYLIELGAPIDEYNHHVDRIMSLLIHSKPDNDIMLKSLLYIFKTNEFSLDLKKMSDLANKLLTL